MTTLKQRWQFLDRWLEGEAMVIVQNGKLLKERADQEKIEESDVLEVARMYQGLERIDQIKYAVLEKNGKITIVPNHK